MAGIEFYNAHNINCIYIKFPDIYFTPEYGLACEYSDNAEWECCVYKDLIYVYLKKIIMHNNMTYYNLITPYGYSGYHYLNKNTYDEFLSLFREKAKQRNYISEIVRQNPYINIQITDYNIITSKTIYTVKIDNFDDYFRIFLCNKKRNKYNKALKKGLNFKIVSLSNGILNEKFIKLYNFTMNKVNANKYYYFNDEYYKTLEKIQNTYLSEILDQDNNTIGCSIIFMYDSYIHYHLSCNDKSMNCITDFLLISIIKEFGIGKQIILGCGIKENDELSKFKGSLGNEKLIYNIYKNIINEDIYNELSNEKGV
jgi:hypothetical protein